MAVRAFPKLPVQRPVAVELKPGTGQILLLQNYAWAEKRSILRRFSPLADVEQADTLLELSEPAYSVGFHPKYNENGWLYLGSNGPGAGWELYSRIVRYTVERQPPHRIVKSSALTVIEWPSAGHNGAAMAFGNDGMLYVTSGDGTGLSDLDNVGQDLSSMRAKVLRLDVDGAPPGQSVCGEGRNPRLRRALGKLASTWVRVPPVELDGSRPKAMSGMKPRGRSRKRDIV